MSRPVAGRWSALVVALALGCGSAEGPPPAGPPPGEPGAPGARGPGGPGGPGGDGAGPQPPPEKLSAPGGAQDVGVASPLTFRSQVPTAILALPKLDWAVVRTASAAHWWNRASGEVGAALSFAPGAAVQLAPSGDLLTVADGVLLRWAAGSETAEKIGASPPGSALRVSATGSWLAVLGPDLVITDARGVESWRGKGLEPLDAAFLGDRLRYVDGGKVFEVHPRDGETTELGPLPQEGAGKWRLGPDGSVASFSGRRVVLHPPGQIGAELAFAAQTLDLESDVVDVGWLDQRRLLVFSAAGAHVFESGRPFTDGGDLADDPSQALLSRFVK